MSSGSCCKMSLKSAGVHPHWFACVHIWAGFAGFAKSAASCCWYRELFAQMAPKPAMKAGPGNCEFCGIGIGSKRWKGTVVTPPVPVGFKYGLITPAGHASMVNSGTPTMSAAGSGTPFTVIGIELTE